MSFFAPDARIEPGICGALEIHFDPDAAAGNKGTDDMRFVALQPKQMIAFDRSAPPYLAEIRGSRTFVVVWSGPVAERATRVTLHCTGWDTGGSWKQTYAHFCRVWGNVLASLAFENGPRDGTDSLRQLDQRRAQAAKAQSGTRL